ncbi:cript family protein [Cryomyces antarcticus]
MVCAKCQKLLKKTELATPNVKKKNEMYFGSPAGSTKSASKGSATLGNTGVGKSKLLSKSAKNPYAAYSSTCGGCTTKVDSGKKFCQRCAFKQNACAMCGKNLTQSKDGGPRNSTPLVSGQRFSAK